MAKIENNTITSSMLKMAKMMKDTNDKLEKFGKMPYGMRKATPAEAKAQRTVAQIAEMEELLNG